MNSVAAPEKPVCRGCGREPELVFQVRLDRLIAGTWSPVESVITRLSCERCRHLAFRDGLLCSMHEDGAGYVVAHCDSCRGVLYGEAWVIEYAPKSSAYGRKARGGALTIQNRVCSRCVLRIGAEFDARVVGGGHMTSTLRGAMSRHGMHFGFGDAIPAEPARFDDAMPSEPPRLAASETLQRLIAASFEQNPSPMGFFTLSGRLLFANTALRVLGGPGMAMMRDQLEPRIEELCLPNAPEPYAVDGVYVMPIRNAMGDIVAVLGVIGLVVEETR